MINKKNKVFLMIISCLIFTSTNIFSLAKGPELMQAVVDQDLADKEYRTMNIMGAGSLIALLGVIAPKDTQAGYYLVGAGFIGYGIYDQYFVETKKAKLNKIFLDKYKDKSEIEQNQEAEKILKDWSLEGENSRIYWSGICGLISLYYLTQTGTNKDAGLNSLIYLAGSGYLYFFDSYGEQKYKEYLEYKQSQGITFNVSPALYPAGIGINLSAQF